MYPMTPEKWTVFLVYATVLWVVAAIALTVFSLYILHLACCKWAEPGPKIAVAAFAVVSAFMIILCVGYPFSVFFENPSFYAGLPLANIIGQSAASSGLHGALALLAVGSFWVLAQPHKICEPW